MPMYRFHPARFPVAACVGGAGALFLSDRRKVGTRRGDSARSQTCLLAMESSSRLNGNALPYLYGTAWKKEATTDLVVQAVRAGFRGIDTACQPKHYREDLVGAALVRLAQEDGISRDMLWLQTKYTPVRGQDPNNIPYNPSAPLATQVEQSIARSLQNLGTSRIDSLVLHSPLPSIEETMEVWRVFEAAVEKGIVGQLGISNCYDMRMFQSLYDSSRIKPKVLQNRFYADSGFDVQLRKYCLERGIVYQSFWTLTANPQILRSDSVQRAASRLNATPAQVLFRWLVQSGHQPLTGTKSIEHMRQDLRVADMVLTKAEMDAIGALFNGGKLEGTCASC
eukprot:TRINITY_DN67913_c0_g1_i1.p1 TRINITY_DN67913_c0_g1~~TRINITY_DN67913_c0_g1_i1.p1  ORF type:complete len:338 (+),score=15.32 TRINITY_DN67913_c0_g1_i1:34-1047(+)